MDEDLRMADSLQEKKVGNNLSSNIQWNHLAKHHLQAAKKLQEDDIKSQTQCQKCYNDLEQKDLETFLEMRS